MAKKSALIVSEAPELERPIPQAFPGVALTAVNREVTCRGGGALDGVWSVPAPIPQELDSGLVRYDLSDRIAGVYVWRHR